MTPRKIAKIFDRLGAANPSPRTELDYSSPFTLLVAVVLSAQSTDAGVNKATRRLFALADTPQKMVALGEDGIREQIRTLGLYNAKARNLHALSKMLIERHGGAVPQDRAALEALPGVGRKTANVVLNVAFGQPTMAVDTHIFRLANRIGIAPGKTPRAVEDRLLALVPKRWRRDAHHLLILHGRYVCKARNPDCAHCVIADLCEWPGKSARALSRGSDAGTDRRADRATHRKS
ncbi:MAG: endonuclease III [Rhodothalassiaceae bacterium]